MFKKSPLFSQQSVLGRIFAHPLVAVALIALESGLLALLQLRSLGAAEGPVVALALIVLAPSVSIMATAYLVSLVSTQIGRSGDPQFKAMFSGWPSALFRREALITGLALAVTISYFSREETRSFEPEQFQYCVQSLHQEKSLRFLATALQKNPHATRAEFWDMCEQAVRVEKMSFSPPSTPAELLRRYAPR